jgi:glutamate-1-semialdehyde 2,1-aminomutase
VSTGTKSAFDIETYVRAKECIAQDGALTNSKRPSCFVEGIYPTHLTRGQDCYVWDTRNNRYLDFCGALGSNLLGYGNHEIGAAIAETYRIGATLSLGTNTEIEFAQELKSIIPFIDLIKVLKSGSEACNAAIKIARTYTDRELVLSEGYHGIGDDFISLTPPALGIPKRHWMGELKHCPIDERVAAVIVEPIMTEITPERIEWLKSLREQCTKAGALLIHDEIITGMRFPQWTASTYFGIQPDLICLGKALGGGLPISVVGGKKEIMNCGEYFVSSTLTKK